MLHFVDIRLAASDVSTCRRCTMASDHSPRDLSDVVDEVKNVCSNWDGALGPNLSFIGGEPFAHRGLPQVLAAAVSTGAQRIRIESDCSALASAESAQHALAQGVRHLRFVLLGPDAHTHDHLVNAPGAFDVLLAGVQHFREAAELSVTGIHVGCRIPVCRHNLQQLPMIVTTALQAGALDVLISIEDPNLDVTTAVAWIEAACDTGTVNGAWVEVEGVPYGLAAGWALHLASNYRHVTGAKADACRECELDPVCGGGVPGASPAAVSRFRPPLGAAETCAQVRRGFEPPRRKDDCA
jgi:hypothetical protein